MAPSKLTKADKQTIIELYCETEETTSTLAERYEVSVSTISRLLKTKLAAEQYETLVRQKRAAGNRSHLVDAAASTDPVSTPATNPTRESIAAPEPQLASSEGSTSPTKAKPVPKPRLVKASDRAVETTAQLDLLAASAASTATSSTQAANAKVFAAEADDSEILADSLADDADLDDDTELVSDDYDDDYEEEELEEDLFDEDEDEDTGDFPVLSPRADAVLTIHDLNEARFPKTCYLVIDRLSELVTCPLNTFQELGQIPEAEASQRTLPLFENHKVARRFSRRHQKVIKVPDGSLLEKTTPWLQAKGITRILLDGEVYALN
ncbi:MAG: transposase [Cyanobacteria bacterium P01_H01_bin.121]